MILPTDGPCYFRRATRTKGGAEVRLSGDRMASYRLYCLDGAGRISLADWFDAPSDDEALKQARILKQGAVRCEVWQGNRLVGRLDQCDLGGLQNRLTPPSAEQDHRLEGQHIP